MNWGDNEQKRADFSFETRENCFFICQFHNKIHLYKQNIWAAPCTVISTVQYYTIEKQKQALGAEKCQVTNDMHSSIYKP